MDNFTYDSLNKGWKIRNLLYDKAEDKSDVFLGSVKKGVNEIEFYGRNEYYPEYEKRSLDIEFASYINSTMALELLPEEEKGIIRNLINYVNN